LRQPINSIILHYATHDKEKASKTIHQKPNQKGTGQVTARREKAASCNSQKD
jgi:hypothetical protein